MRSKILVTACVLIWVVAVAVGWSSMTRFTRTPGAQGTAPLTLTAGMLPPGLLNQAHASAVIVALHPLCACSVATLLQLRRVLARSGASPNVILLVYTPAHTPTGWHDSGTLLKAADTLGARVVRDTDGRWSAGLGARTSGDVLLYSGGGRLLFEGGVTDQRGQAGESVAAEVLTRALLSNQQTSFRPGVFGCALFAARQTR